MNSIAKKWILATAGIAVAALLWLMISPPRAWLDWTRRVDLGNPVATGESLVEKYRCRDCHCIGGVGALKAPDLEGTTRRLNNQVLSLWLSDPKTIRKDTAMPNFHLPETEITAPIAYLRVIGG